MEIIALGDTHGRTDWKQIVRTSNSDKIIFIGDYFDTHEDISAEQQIKNFHEIIVFKKANMNRVVLLFGNHDYHYLRTVDETYSGFQQWGKTDIQETLHKALDENLMQMCFVFDKYLFTHAGVTKTWLKSVGYTDQPLETFLNDLFKYQPLAFRFTPGNYLSPYGDEICQTPIWVRPNSLFDDAIDGFIQVVGHTTQKELLLNHKIVLIDTLGTSGQYLSISNGKMIVSEQRHWQTLIKY